MNERHKENIRNTIIWRIPSISTFDSIVFKNDKPLVICDIDETILYLDEPQSASNNFHLLYNKHKSLSYSSTYNNSRPVARSIFPTDIQGFRRFEERISSLGGKLIFLTARQSSGYQYVVEDFSKIGLDASKYEIHYTGNVISKGDYMRVRMDLSGYNDIYFIDDIKDNILSVYQYFPQTKLYLFCRK